MAGYKLKDSKESSKRNSKYVLFSTSECNDELTIRETTYSDDYMFSKCEGQIHISEYSMVALLHLLVSLINVNEQ